MAVIAYNDKREMFKHQMNIFSSQPVIKTEDVAAIKQLLYTSQSCINAIAKLGINLDANEQIFAYFVIMKLPPETHAQCEQTFGSSTEIPKWTELVDALKSRIKTLQAIAVKSHTPSNSHSGVKSTNKSNATPFATKSKNYNPTQKSVHAVTNPAEVQLETKAEGKSSLLSCSLCSKPHVLRTCPTFLNMSTIERKAEVDKLNLCFNCLAYNHRLVACSSNKTCALCNGRHHTLLHISKSTVNGSKSLTSNHTASPCIDNIADASPESSSVHPIVNLHRDVTSIRQTILLATAVIYVRSSSGKLVPLRALLDQGSQATLITERAVQQLQLSKKAANCTIYGVGSAQSELPSCVQLDIHSSYERQFHTNVCAFVMTKVTSLLPQERIIPQTWPHITSLALADPHYAEPGHIDILLGADVYDDVIRLGIRHGERGQPIAQLTAFGWILSGKTTNPQSHNSLVVSCHAKIEFDLQKFWELENVSEQRTLSAEDQWTEEFFKRTHSRSDTGKFCTRLPMKRQFDPSAVLGRSYTIALNRFHALERRLRRDPNLHAAYSQCINEYLQLGQMQLVTTTEDDHRTGNIFNCCYLPHHAVVKESSSTTKLRVVFDASTKTSNGRSLNDVLTTGPALQCELIFVIMNWRFFKYVFIADIEKMYRRIEMHPEDAEFQRILWRPDPNSEIKIYKLITVTFGTSSAPYIAIRTVHQLAEDECHRFPLAAEVLKRHMYIDDVFSGGHTVESTKQLQLELINIMKSGSFDLRKWCSNCKEVLESIPVSHREKKADLLLNAAESVKALGLYWNPISDNFQFKFDFEFNMGQLTKRKVVATISRLFDPLGWLNPIVVIAKMHVKRLWQLGVDWDDTLPDDFSHEWHHYLEQLRDIERITIPRWLQTTEPMHSYELHIFCDGSMVAYSATVYLRSTHINQHVSTDLLIAKCRISPMKTITIARIELCGAVLAAKLENVVRQQISIPSVKLRSFFWTDSTIVINWLKGDPNRWQTFVSNRVNAILTTTQVHQWRHVPTKHNPADISSRGTTALNLIDHNLWWKGPTWLTEPASMWPVSEVNPNQPEIDEAELKKSAARVHVATTSEVHNIISQFSSLTNLLRAITICLRFSHNGAKKNRHNRIVSPITVAELRQSTRRLIQLVQSEHFEQDIKALQANQTVGKKSRLIKLCPFLDGEGIIRVGGRLQNSTLTHDERHPIILPEKHPFTNLVVHDIHFITLHGGIQAMLTLLRRRYWVLNGRNVVRTYVHRCVECYRNRPKLSSQLMGNLPAVRTTPSRAFSATGIDYAGPIDIRATKGRGRIAHKGYIAVFVCMSTRAIHLEAVSDLTTAAFIAALNRFIARRGLCHDIYSDCGTNFIGADNELIRNAKLSQRLIESNVMPFLSSREIQWHFNPPASPHFGGLWEAAVKSTKRHLRHILRNTTLTYEELSTVLCQIEACLNSRPLAPLTDDPNDLSALTPGHFLIFDSLLAAPTKQTEQLNVYDRWQQLQLLVQHFWRRWSTEYLTQLQTRPKWTQPEKNFKIGELVLLRDERLPPNQWLLGRILELHPGPDEYVRVVTVKTKNGTLKRPVVKLCRLPIASNESNSATAPSSA